MEENNLSMVNIIKSGFSPGSSGREAAMEQKKIFSSMGAAMGGPMGAAMGGPMGAAIGAIIGAAIFVPKK